MIDKQVNSPASTLDIFDWSDVFASGPHGNGARGYFLALPKIRRFRSDAVFRLLFDGESLTMAGRILGLVFKALSALSFGRFAPFHLREGEIEFPAFVISAKRMTAAVLKSLRGSPAYFSGGLLLNLLGYQVLRTISYHLRLRLRRHSVAAGHPKSALEKTMLKRGYVVLEDVLHPKTLTELNRILDQREDILTYKREEHSCGWSKRTLHGGGESFSAAESSNDECVRDVLSNRGVFELIERLLGRRLNVTPEVAIFEWSVPADKTCTPHQFDFEDMLHADVSYPSYKIFLYLNDVTAANGPFVYCPGTHSLSLKRLVFEYAVSVAYYLTGKEAPQQPQPHKFTNWLVHRFGIEIVPVVARANSMVLADVMGFHGRRRFESIVPRRALFMNFRYLDAKLIY